MELQYLVEDSNQNPVLLSVPISIPVDFYAEIDPIESPVTDRVLTISGTVANPMLQNANLIIDGESEQAFEVELTNGRFSQQVAIGGSTAETPTLWNLLPLLALLPLRPQQTSLHRYCPPPSGLPFPGIPGERCGSLGHRSNANAAITQTAIQPAD